MTKQVALDEDVHADLLLLKAIKRKGEPDRYKNLSDVIRFLMNHAGYYELFFDKMRELGVSEHE